MAEDKANVPATVLSVKDLVTERIRANFVQLIPEDVFTAMVAKELNDFTAERTVDGGYNRRTSSQFRDIIRAELEAQFKALVKEELSKPEFSASLWERVPGTQGMTGPVPSLFVQELIRQAMPDMFTHIMGFMVQEQLNNMRNSGRF